VSTVRPKMDGFVGGPSGPVWLSTADDWPADDQMVADRPELFTAPVQPVPPSPQPKSGRQGRPARNADD
jgi:hypothetical protein